jgi:hypothetical protein
MNGNGPCAALITTTAGGTGAGTVGTGSVTTAYESGFGYADYFNKRIATYDAVAGKFYIMNYGTSGIVNSLTGNKEGVWSATDPTAAWTQVFQGSISNGPDFYHAKLKAVPGNAGHLFFTAGQVTGSDPPFKRSTDGGATWQTVTSFSSVVDFSFGKVAPGKTYPSIYLYGKMSGVNGLYRSDDNCTTWVQMTNAFPLNRLDGVQCVGADQNIYGRVYVGFGGSSFVYCDYDDKITVS